MTDTSTLEARSAIEGTLDRFADWRQSLAKIGVQAQRRLSAGERAAMIERCEQIESELLAARTDLLEKLVDTPRPVRGHSRVADVERAMDAIERDLLELTKTLKPGRAAH